METRRNLLVLLAVAAWAAVSPVVRADEPKALNLPTAEQRAEMAGLDAAMVKMGDEQRRVALVEAVEKYKGTAVEGTVQLRLAFAQFNLGDFDGAKKTLEKLVADDKSVAMPNNTPVDNPDAPALTKDEEAMLAAVSGHLEKEVRPVSEVALVLLAAVQQQQEDYAGMWKTCEKALAAGNAHAGADREFFARLGKQYPAFTPHVAKWEAIKTASMQVILKLAENRLSGVLEVEETFGKDPAVRAKMGVTEADVAWTIVREFKDYDYLMTDEAVTGLSQEGMDLLGKAKAAEWKGTISIEDAKKLIEKAKESRPH